MCLLTGGSSQSRAKLTNASNMTLPTSSSWSVGRRNSNSSAVQSSAGLDPTSPGNSAEMLANSCVTSCFKPVEFSYYM